jgi:hypothetical protein
VLVTSILRPFGLPEGAGSLATLLWRQVLGTEHRPRLGEFTVFGLLTVSLTLAAAARLCGW